MVHARRAAEGRAGGGETGVVGYRGIGMATPSAEQINAAVSGFDALYGLELLEYGDGRVRGQVKVRDELKQLAGLIHGGVYAAIAESIASLATALAVASEGNTAMGLSNSTSFLRPITEGVVHAEATRLHRGRTTWVWDVRFSDDADRTCAVTRMTIAVRPRPDGQRPRTG
jgi:1,4-dihydroxy-2-naphthoyl-CoA hydrolase